MNANDPTPITVSETPKFDTSEVRKVSFWVANIFVLAATIAGVYLAANQGFKQAIAYEKLMSDKSNYFLRLSLRDELADNVEAVKGYMERLKKGGIAARKAAFQMDTFIWDAMKFSSATLETPTPMLTASRKFYHDVADIHQKVVNNVFEVETANKRLSELVENIEKTTIPMFDKDTKALREHLTQNGIAL